VYSSSGFKSTGACLLFIEGKMPKNTIKELIQNRIVQANTRLNTGMFDRFTQRLLRMALFGYVWIECPQFNIDEHIIEPAEPASPLKTNADLQVYVSKLIKAHKFRLDAPLWSVYYIKNFGQYEKTTVVMFVFHQCFSDGVSLARLFFKGVVDNRNAMDVKPRFAYSNFSLSLVKQMLFSWSKIFHYICFKRRDRNPIHVHNYTSKEFRKLDLNGKRPNNGTTGDGADGANSKYSLSFFDKMKYSFTSNQNQKRYNLITRKRVFYHNIYSYFNKLILICLSVQLKEESPEESGNETLVWSEPFDIMLLNRLKLVTRSRMNELLMSIVTGIVRNYLQLKGVNNPKRMHCLMSVDLSSNKYPFKLANHSSLTSLSLPVNVEGCVPRLWYTKTSMANLKQSGDYLFVYFLINCLFFVLPDQMAYRLCASVFDKNTIIASTLGAGDANLSTVSVCNRSVKSIIYFYPCVANVPISFSIMTYGDEVRLALVADTNIITKPELITTEFNNQVSTILFLYLF
jgi:hypothetical protein